MTLTKAHIVEKQKELQDKKVDDAINKAWQEK